MARKHSQPTRKDIRKNESSLRRWTRQHVQLVAAAAAFAVCGLVIAVTSQASAATVSQSSTTRTGEISSKEDNDKCIDVVDGKKENGTKVRLWPCNDEVAQRIKIELGPKGHVMLKVVDNCLDVAGASKEKGAKVQLYKCNNNSKAQQFLLTTNGDIVNPNSGKCVGMENDDFSKGEKDGLGIYDCNMKRKQLWKFPSGAARIQANAQIKYYTDEGLCIESTGRSSAAKMALCKDGRKQQRWLVMSLNNGSAYRLMNGGRCLEPNDNDEVVTAACTNGKEQQWNLVSGRLKHAGTSGSKCIDTVDQTEDYNQPLSLHDCKSSDMQRIKMPKSRVSS